jgi:hypothetical protein
MPQVGFFAGAGCAAVQIAQRAVAGVRGQTRVSRSLDGSIVVRARRMLRSDDAQRLFRAAPAHFSTVSPETPP